jgi:hypothetical protein
MSTWVDTAKRAFSDGRHIVVERESGLEMKFPVAVNPRLAVGTLAQFNHIELSPYGLHWPDLDEDLSFQGIRQGHYGQHRTAPRS